MEFLKKVRIVGVVSATVIGASFGLSSKTSADFDLAGLNTQVQQQQVQLDNLNTKVDNHEQRITNLENNTAPQPVQPAPVNTTTPATQVSAPVVAAAPTTKTIVAVGSEADPGAVVMTFGDTQTVWCSYIYSDGSKSYEHQSYNPSVGPTLVCKAVGDSVPL